MTVDTWTVDTWPTRPHRDDELTTDQILDVLDLVDTVTAVEPTSEGADRG